MPVTKKHMHTEVSKKKLIEENKEITAISNRKNCLINICFNCYTCGYKQDKI